MTSALKTAIAGGSCALLLALVLWGFHALPPFGHYAGPYGESSMRSRRTSVSCRTRSAP